MAKKERTNVEVDENLIHSMMEGDIPSMRQESEPSKPDEPADRSGPKDDETPSSRPRKRREQKGYSELFLERSATVPKKHTYISLEMHNKLMELLPVIARGLTLPNFLENLLNHHFDTYRDEINELYSGKTQKKF